MNISLKLSDADSRKFAAKLLQMRKYDFPLAVRGTLNAAANDLKVMSIPTEFNKNFTIRKKTFLKAMSGWDKCGNTFDVSKMVSTSGIRMNQDKEKASLGLEELEIGGFHEDRHVPTKFTRIGESENRLMKRKDWYQQHMSNFEGTGINAKGRKGTPYFTHINKKNGQHVRFFQRISKNKILFLYAARDVYNGKHPFMTVSNRNTGFRMTGFFKIEANRRFDKLLK